MLQPLYGTADQRAGRRQQHLLDGWGTGELSYPVWRNVSAVIEAGGQHTSRIPGSNVGLSLVTGMGGVRMRFPTRTPESSRPQWLFTEVELGSKHPLVR